MYHLEVGLIEMFLTHSHPWTPIFVLHIRVSLHRFAQIEELHFKRENSAPHPLVLVILFEQAAIGPVVGWVRHVVVKIIEVAIYLCFEQS